MEFFAKQPLAQPLFEAVASKILANFPQVEIQVKKTQISFRERYLFAAVSLPRRKIKETPGSCIIVTFGLARHLEHPRIMEAVEPYPNRWTHHVLVRDISEVDEELMEWIREAHDFALTK